MNRVLFVLVLCLVSGCSTYRSMKEASRRDEILRDYLREWTYAGPLDRVISLIRTDVDRKHRRLVAESSWYRFFNAMAMPAGGLVATDGRNPEDGGREIESPTDVYRVLPAPGGAFRIVILDKANRMRDYNRELEFLEATDPEAAGELKAGIQAVFPEFRI